MIINQNLSIFEHVQKRFVIFIINKGENIHVYSHWKWRQQRDLIHQLLYLHIVSCRANTHFLRYNQIQTQNLSSKPHFLNNETSKQANDQLIYSYESSNRVFDAISSNRFHVNFHFELKVLVLNRGNSILIKTSMPQILQLLRRGIMINKKRLPDQNFVLDTMMSIVSWVQLLKLQIRKSQSCWLGHMQMII